LLSSRSWLVIARKAPRELGDWIVGGGDLHNLHVQDSILCEVLSDKLSLVVVLQEPFGRVQRGGQLKVAAMVLLLDDRQR
jgi:hypothetical protein